ncbi:MAG: riboflavin synthase [Desulfobaccales bacterium]|jgi:riboflavin synthase
MFTGLVEGVGEIVGLTPLAEGLKVTVKTPFPVAELSLGESVAVAGACLTVVAIAPPAASFEVSPETLARTTFTLKKVGDRVNLERSLRLGDRLGGHLVTGHVDAAGVVGQLRSGPAYFQLQIELPAPLGTLVIEKGSIAVDGVSLTVNSIKGAAFSVNIIPFTARKTTLGALRVGDRVNLEADLIGKYVARLLGKDSGIGQGVTVEVLTRHGFL